MEELKKLVVSYLGKTLNKPAEEVSSLLFSKEADTEVVKSDALDALFSLDKTRVQTFENENKNHYDKGYKKAQAESLSKFEKDAKEKFGITEEKQGLELIDAIIAKKVTAPGEVTDDQVKRSKAYLDALDTFKKEKEQAVKEWQDKFDGREKQLQKEATLKSISEKALSFVETLKPILPTDPARAKNQLNTLVDKLNGYEYEIKEDGKIVILKREGDESRVLLDEFKHPVTFEDLVKKHASDYWDFQTGDDRRGPGNNNDNNGGQGASKGYKGPIPKTEAEYLDLISKTTDEATQIEITNAFTGRK